jgi:hypothetical protein
VVAYSDIKETKLKYKVSNINKFIVSLGGLLRFHLTPIRIATIKNTTTTNVGEDVRKKETHTLLLEM